MSAGKQREGMSVQTRTIFRLIRPYRTLKEAL